MFKPLIPYNWDPPSNDWEEAHFQFSDVEGGRQLFWPLTGVTLLIPDTKYYATLDQIQEANKDSFARYELYGFSSNNYHEFILLDNRDSVRECAFKMGSVEITFGDASPLAALAFDAYHREKYFGDWSQITSLRIFGPTIDQIEVYFISALKAYEGKFHSLPVPYQLDESFLFELEDDETQSICNIIMPPVADTLIPLRFYYLGLRQNDDVSASINFYKVIEFFSFMSNEKSISKLRHDQTCSDAEFSKQILKFLTKEDKGTIFSLLTKITPTPMLSSTQKDGLTTGANIQQFCEALYAFRDSIVHGKFSYGYDLRSDSVLTTETSASKWKTVLKDLAKICLEQIAPKKF